MRPADATVCILSFLCCHCRLGIVLVFTLPNLISTDVVGNSLIVLMFVVIMPYIPLILIGLTKARVANLLRPPPHGVQVRMLPWPTYCMRRECTA